MKHTTHRLGVRSSAVVFVAMAALAVPSAASAAPIDPADKASGLVVSGMEVVGFDEAVANANGYEIITDASGHQQSVPVSEAAKAREAQNVDPLEIAQRKDLSGTVGINAFEYDEVVGNCGLSYIGAEKGANDVVSYETGFIVRDAVRSYTWTVVAQGFITGQSDSYAGGPRGPEFEASGTLTAIGFGNAFVPGLSPTAEAILVDGSVCSSGGPSVGFP